MTAIPSPISLNTLQLRPGDLLLIDGRTVRVGYWTHSGIFAGLPVSVTFDTADVETGVEGSITGTVMDRWTVTQVVKTSRPYRTPEQEHVA